MKKKVMTVLIAAGVLLGGLYLAKDILAKALITAAVESMTGLKVRIEKITLGIFSNTIRIRGFALYNPPSYNKKLMVDIQELYLRYNPAEAAKGKVYLNELKVHLKEFTAARNRVGDFNVSSLQGLQPKGEGEAPAFKIDSLDLRIDKVGYIDETAEPARAYEFNANVDEHFEGIESPQALAELILVRVLQSGALAQFGLSELSEDMSEKAKEAQKTAEEFKLKVKGELRSTRQDLKRIFSPTP